MSMFMDEVIERYLRLLHDKTMEYYSTHYSSLTPPTYTLERGSKYIRVVSDNGRHRHVHSFINRKTGGLHKAASWKAPVKDERYNLLTDLPTLRLRIDPNGGYLYKRG